MITRDNLDNWFNYHAPESERSWRVTTGAGVRAGDRRAYEDGEYLAQSERYEALRAAALAFAQVVLVMTPASADQKAAIRKIREAVMTANAAIACDGK